MNQEYQCPECEGEGECRYMVCYGGPPHEKTEECSLCEGTGTIQSYDPEEHLSDPPYDPAALAPLQSIQESKDFDEQPMTPIELFTLFIVMTMILMVGLAVGVQFLRWLFL